MITPCRTNVSVENRSRGRIHLPVGLLCVCVCVRAWSRVWGCWRKYPKKRYAVLVSEVRIIVTLQTFLCQNTSSLLWDPTVHYRDHKSSFSHNMPSQINPVQNFTASFVNILIFSGHLGQGISGSCTLQAFQVKPCLFIVLFQASDILRATLSLKEQGEKKFFLTF